MFLIRVHSNFALKSLNSPINWEKSVKITPIFTWQPFCVLYNKNCKLKFNYLTNFHQNISAICWSTLYSLNTESQLHLKFRFTPRIWKFSVISVRRSGKYCFRRRKKFRHSMKKSKKSEKYRLYSTFFLRNCHNRSIEFRFGEYANKKEMRALVLIKNSRKSFEW